MFFWVCQVALRACLVTVLKLFGWKGLVLMGSRLCSASAVPGPFGACVCFVRGASSSKLGRHSFLRPLYERLVSYA
jgi:hypothetical protein